MDKWEYLIVRYFDDSAENFESYLNDFGEAGWELVTIIFKFPKYEFFLKRKIQQENGKA